MPKIAESQFSDSHLSSKTTIEGFLLDLGTSRSLGTIENYRCSLGQLREYAEAQGWPPVPQLTVHHLRAYLAGIRNRPRWFGERDAGRKPISSSYYETIYRRIKRFFNWLVDEGEIPPAPGKAEPENPMARIKHPRIDQRVIPIVTDEDFGRLLRRTAPEFCRTQSEKFRAYRDQAVLWLLMDTSGRKEGITGISIEDLDLQAHRVLVMEKGRKERYLFIGNTASKALWRYLREREKTRPITDDLWVDAEGNPMSPNWLYLMLKRLGQRAGVPNLHTHRFRHTYSIKMIEAGVPLPVLEVMGGWKRIPQTYLATLGEKQAQQFHRQASPGDTLAKKVRRK